MSLALATKGIISVGVITVAVPLCDPALGADPYGELQISSAEPVEGPKPFVSGEDLRPNIKISIEE